MPAHPTTTAATGVGWTLLGVLIFAGLLSCAGPALDATAEQAQATLNSAEQDWQFIEASEKRAAREREACPNAPSVWVEGAPVCLPRRSRK